MTSFLDSVLLGCVFIALGAIVLINIARWRK